MPLIALKNEHSRLLLLTSLIFYLVARILQLFAGKAPSLLIVILHVIPPALFAVIHGARIYRSRGILVFATLCLGVGSLFESLSLRAGFPFGHYRFTNLMGPKLFDLPVLLALAYVGTGYLSWVLALVILECQNKPLSGRKVAPQLRVDRSANASVNADGMAKFSIYNFESGTLVGSSPPRC